ncbi:hypothetical protein N405_00300 [Helicobacter pylori FD568]|nr:hypothetical protein N405_00300 [Helicobacter pylori FD568]
MKNKLATPVSLKNSKIALAYLLLTFCRGALNKSLKHSFFRLYIWAFSSLSLRLVLGLSFLKTTAFLKSLDFKLFGFFAVSLRFCHAKIFEI